MGMYTKFEIHAELKSPHPLKPDWREVEWPGDDFHWPEHESFKAERFGMVLSGMELKGNMLSVECDIKNYDSDIDKFMSFISPYISLLLSGHYHYEEQRGPIPLLIKDGKLEADWDHPNAKIDF